MKKIIFTFLVVLVSTNFVFSQRQQISYQEAGDAAANWIHAHFPEYQSGKNVVSMSNQRGHTLLYEIRFDSINVLLSGSKACLPVLGYYKGDVSIINNIDNLPCNLAAFINSFIEEIEGCFENDTIQFYHHEEWTDLIEGVSLREERTTVIVPPLIQTKWNQSWSNDNCDPIAYNYMVPPDNGLHCLHQLVGCGAVALAQVMNYWQYPLLYQARQQFDWCNMTDSLNKCNDHSYEKHRDAIALLMYSCAEDIISEYGCFETTSNLDNTRNALVNQYGYSNSATHRYRTSDFDSWISLIKQNLDEGKPVIYRGSGSGGHAFVCDGYDSEYKFHFNWGWAGRGDGYYTLNNLTPNGHNYNNYQAAIVYIKPGTNSSICNAILFLDDFYHDNASLLNNHRPYEITPQTMTTLTSASATSDASWRTIPSGATAVYQAHKEIILQDGFEAQLGSEFEARIEPCEQCDETRGNEYFGNNVNTDNGGYDTDDEMLYSPGTTHKVVDTDLFPNPTDGPLTMHTEGKPQKVLVYTLDGLPIGGWYLTAFGDNSVTLNVSPLRPGTYLLSVITSTEIHTARFVRN